MSEPNETPQHDGNYEDERIVERLTALTSRGGILWRRVHEDGDAYDLEEAERTTHVVAYSAEDDDFGRILFRLPDPSYDDAPDQYVLIISGEHVEASQADLSALHDHIIVYLRDIMAGLAEPAANVMDEVLDQVQEHQQQQQRAYSVMIDRVMTQVERQIDLLDRALTAVTNAQELHNKSMVGHRTEPGYDAYIPLDHGAVATVLRVYADILGLPEEARPSPEDVEAVLAQIYGPNR